MSYPVDGRERKSEEEDIDNYTEEKKEGEIRVWKKRRKILRRERRGDRGREGGRRQETREGGRA